MDTKDEEKQEIDVSLVNVIIVFLSFCYFHSLSPKGEFPQPGSQDFYSEMASFQAG